MRMGMFGGAFDPPHNAHVALARAAVAQLQLGELRIFPTGRPWHRTEKLTPPEDRLAMARAAFSALPQSVVDDREVLRAGPTYTIDTLRELRRESQGIELFLVMGEDQARAFTGWHEWAEIARIATLCVAHRTDPASTAGPAINVPGATIALLQLPDMPESATEIRRRAAKGEDISSLVPPGVAGYIAAHHLYRGN